MRERERGRVGRAGGRERALIVLRSRIIVVRTRTWNIIVHDERDSGRDANMRTGLRTGTGLTSR